MRMYELETKRLSLSLYVWMLSLLLYVATLWRQLCGGFFACLLHCVMVLGITRQETDIGIVYVCMCVNINDRWEKMHANINFQITLVSAPAHNSSVLPSRLVLQF